PRFEHADTFDWSAYASASPAQRAPAVAADEIIDLTGLCRDGERRWVQLPGLAPIVTIDISGVARGVAMTCDTLWIGVDGERCVVTYRGSTPVGADGRDVGRIAVWLAPMDQASRPRDERLPALQRGFLGFALRPGESPDRAGAQDEDERNTLQMQRYATW